MLPAKGEGLLNNAYQAAACVPERKLARLWAALVALSAVIAVTAACGNDGPSVGSPTPQATAAATPIASPAALAAPCQTLVDAKTFRYVARRTYESPDTTETPTAEMPLPSSTLTRDFGAEPFSDEYVVDGSVVAPDRHYFKITATGGEPFGAIVIGSQLWWEEGGVWEARSGPLAVSYQPPGVCQAILSELDLGQAEPQREEIDGLQTIHYSFPKNPSPSGMAQVFGENSDAALLVPAPDVDVWLSEDGQELVRLELGGKGLYSDGRLLIVRLVIDVRDINDESITIEPPI